MNENEEKVVLPFRPEITLTISKKALRDAIDTLADKIAERMAIYLAVMHECVQEQQPASGSAADPRHDDPNEPWGDESETEGNDE